MFRILVVDDEAKIRKVIRAYLEENDYQVETAADGQKALAKVRKFAFDLVVLDLMLPGLSGEEVCQRIRQQSGLPVLMLTAKDDEEDKIQGFNYGADDYLVKPFSPRELVARIRAILRRSDYQAEKAEVLCYDDGNLEIYPAEMRIEYRGKKVDLTVTEFKLLYILAKNQGQVLSREQLAEKIMGLEFSGFDRTIDAHIKNVRKKLDLAKNHLIVTVYGAGYKFMGDEG